MKKSVTGGHDHIAGYPRLTLSIANLNDGRREDFEHDNLACCNADLLAAGGNFDPRYRSDPSLSRVSSYACSVEGSVSRCVDGARVLLPCERRPMIE
jgi:hypothetical protein